MEAMYLQRAKTVEVYWRWKIIMFDDFLCDEWKENGKILFTIVVRLCEWRWKSNNVSNNLVNSEATPANIGMHCIYCVETHL